MSVSLAVNPPPGQTYQVTVTVSPGGGAVSAFWDQGLTAPVTFPVAVTAGPQATVWYFSAAQNVLVSCKQSGVEYATSQGTAVQVALSSSPSTVAPLAPSPLGTNANAVWSQPSPLGASARPAVVLLMSAYDTNPSSTDQTAAFQAAVNAAGTILASGQVSQVDIYLDSRQKYNWGGAVTAGAHGEFAQVILPWTQTWSGTIRLVGMPGYDGSYIGYGGGAHTTIECTLSSAPTFSGTAGIASMVGGPASFGTNQSPSSMSLLRLGLENVVFRQAAGSTGPVIAGVDAGWLAGLFSEGHLGFTTDAWDLGTFPFNIASAVVCTNGQGVSLITPFIGNYYGTYIKELSVSGWRTGPVIGEAVHIDELRVFACPLAISLDTANEGSYIGQFYDWDNGTGIGTFGVGTNTINAPTATGIGSKVVGVVPTPLTIANWQCQLAAAAAPTQLQRSAASNPYDVFDGNGLCSITAAMRSNQGGAGGTLVVRVPVVLGSGSTLTGSTGVRVVDANRTPGPHGNTPASATTVRNPMGRDSWVYLQSGSLTAITIDGNSAGLSLTGPWFVRANGTINVTYTSAALVWVCT